MVAELTALGVALVTAAAEWLHQRRCHRVARLAFGPSGQGRTWTRPAPVWRIAAAAALAWGLVTLLLLTPKVHVADAVQSSDPLRRLVIVLDVSPSMRLQDAGETGKQSRTQRVADLMQSFFRRVSMDRYRVTVIAVYNGAKPVVQDTKDPDVVDNILSDLPMQFAFPAGDTRLFDGLQEAARIARPWPPQSTTVVLLSDGDTVPASGMPTMPASVNGLLVVGVGDTRRGQFINGRQSRQDASTLRQIAVRLRGSYHNGNEHHIPTEMLRLVTASKRRSRWERLSRREYALMASAAGASVLALLPWLLHYGGTTWQPGPPSPLGRRGQRGRRRERSPESAGAV